jgi:hypothetical protein
MMFGMRRQTTLSIRTFKGKLPAQVWIALWIFPLLLAGCSPAAQTAVRLSTQDDAPTAVFRYIDIYASPATRPWLSDFYACALEFPAADTFLRIADSPEAAQVVLRLGEPEHLTGFSYQIGADDLLVVAHRQSPLQNMGQDEVQALFAGRGELPGVQVWAYAAGEDIQRSFQNQVMGAVTLTSLAKLVANPQQMSDTLNNDPNSVGILLRRWKMGDSRILFSLDGLPVLALTPQEPEAPLRQWIACVQQKTAP